MPSGIFFIGNYDLSLEAFSRFIEPVLNERGYSVAGKVELNKESNEGELVLIALSGEGDVEAGLKQALEEAGNRNDAYNNTKEEYEPVRTPSFKINRYTAIAVYTETSAASSSFGEFVRDYLSRRALKSSQEAVDNLHELETREETLKKRLRILSETPLGEIK